MRKLTKTFLAGLITILPLLLSVALVVWLIETLEAVANKYLLWFLPDFLHIPGMGIVLGVMIVFAVGLLMELPGAKGALQKIEVPFSNVPLVKSVYFAIKDLTGFFTADKEKKSGQVVLLTMPGGWQIVGLMTRSDFSDLPSSLKQEDQVVVYIPMSYQIGGVSVFVPKSWVTPIELDVESTMRMILTAWMPGGGAGNSGQNAKSRN